MTMYMIYFAVAVAVAAMFTLWVINLRRVVPTNMVDIVQYRKKTISYGSGQSGNVYYEWPKWLPLVGVTVTQLPVSVINVTLKDYAAYDAARLPFVVDVAAFFRVSDPNMAAQRVSNLSELQFQLGEILKGTVRVTLAQHKLEEIMQDRVILGSTFTAQVQDTLKKWGVETVQDIQFMDLRDAADSKVIHNIMAKDQSRIDKESRMTVADNQRAAQEAEIEASRQVELQKQEAIEQVGIRTATQTRQVGIANQQAEQKVLAETQTTKTAEMAVKQVEVVRSAEIERDAATVKAEQERNVTVIEADAEKQRMTTVADGTLAAASREAEATKLKGEAEGRAKEAVLQAEVAPQITLAKEIGSNDNYQKYLVNVKQVEANRDIGIAQAGALTAADIKVIANGGTITGGISSISELLSSKGGQAISSMIAGLAQTDEGAAVIEAVTTKKKNGGAVTTRQ